MNNTIVITGASSGIGRATALYFAEKGWNVAATMRNPAKETELQKHSSIKLFALDVTNDESIQQAVDSILATFNKVDVVVNNAGYGAVGAFEAASQEQIKRQFDTNVFGLMNVTRAFLPHFRANKAGTFINIASVGGRITFPIYSLYHGTKWAVEGFSESLNFELNPLGIKVKIVEPGPIRTDFYDRSMDTFVKPGLTAYDSYVKRLLGKINSFGANAPGPIVVAKAVYRAANSGGFKLRYPVGGGAVVFLGIRRLLGGNIFTRIVKLVMS